MNIASCIFFISYIPLLYDTINHKNISSIPEKFLSFIGSSLAFSYSVLNTDKSLMTNYGIIVILDFTGIVLKSYYFYVNDYKHVDHLSDTDEKIDVVVKL